MKTRGMLLKHMIRRSMAGIVTIAFGLSLGTSVALAAPIKGDCSGDGQIRAVDALLALQYAAGLMTPSATTDAHFMACADVYPLDPTTHLPKGDGSVRSVDALTILQAGAGLLDFSQASIPVAIIKISTILTSGTLTSGTKIGGVQATVTYPSAKAMIVDTDVIGAVGNGTGTSCGPANQTCYMLVANTITTPNQVVVAMINPTGISNLGEIATLNFHVPVGTPAPAKPAATEFTISNVVVFDSTGQTIPNVSVGITTAAIQ